MRDLTRWIANAWIADNPEHQGSKRVQSGGTRVLARLRRISNPKIGEVVRGARKLSLPKLEWIASGSWAEVPGEPSNLSANGAQPRVVELIETSGFTGQIMEILDDDAYREFQRELAANPAKGPLIRGGGGIRKIRVAVGSRGKSGGARVIYYWAVRRNLILPLFAFPKNVVASLTAAQTAQLAKIVKEEFGDEAKRA